MSDLYDLPNGWEWKKLNEVFIVKDGTHDSPKYISENGFPLFTSKNLKENGLDKDNYKLISEEDYNKINQRSKVDKGDLLFAMIGTIGNPTIVEHEPNFAIKNVALFKPMDTNNLIELLKYYFLSNTVIDKMISEAKGATQKFVGLTYLRNFSFPSIPLSEQQRIISKLDNLFEKIDKSISLHQKNMDEADVFIGSILNDVFGDLEEKYGLIKINDTVLKTKNRNPKEDLDKPFTYIDISSIDNKLFKIIEPKQLIGSEAPSRAKKEVFFGDILYSTTRPNLKNISIISKEYDNSIASTGFCVLRTNDNTINSYLFYYLITDKLFEQIEPNIRGAQYPATSDKDLKNCNIPNTPLNIQHKIVKYLDEVLGKIEKIKSIQKEKMDNLKALKASILDKAFRGEL